MFHDCIQCMMDCISDLLAEVDRLRKDLEALTLMSKYSSGCRSTGDSSGEIIAGYFFPVKLTTENKEMFIKVADCLRGKRKAEK